MSWSSWSAFDDLLKILHRSWDCTGCLWTPATHFLWLTLPAAGRGYSDWVPHLDTVSLCEVSLSGFWISLLPQPSEDPSACSHWDWALAGRYPRMQGVTPDCLWSMPLGGCFACRLPNSLNRLHLIFQSGSWCFPLNNGGPQDRFLSQLFCSCKHPCIAASALPL